MWSRDHLVTFLTSLSYLILSESICCKRQLPSINYFNPVCYLLTLHPTFAELHLRWSGREAIKDQQPRRETGFARRLPHLKISANENTDFPLISYRRLPCSSRIQYLIHQICRNYFAKLNYKNCAPIPIMTAERFVVRDCSLALSPCPARKTKTDIKAPTSDFQNGRTDHRKNCRHREIPLRS
jgi:hypothetical protein